MGSAQRNENFLHLILEGCAISEKGELKSSVFKLHEDMLNLKFSVKEVIEDTYVNFIKVAQEHRQLLLKAEELKKKIEGLSNKVNNHITPKLKCTSHEIQQLSDSLQEIRIMFTYIDHLLELNSLFQTVSKLGDGKEYLEMAKTFTRIRDILEEPTDRENNLEIYEALANEYVFQCASFMDDMHDIWRDCVKLETKLTENSPNIQVCTLQVNIARSEEIAYVLLALNCMESTTLYLKRFSEKVLECLLMPVIKQQAHAHIAIYDKNACLTVEGKDFDESQGSNICENLCTVFGFIHSHLEYNIDDGVTLPNKIGSSIGLEFYDTLIEHCSQIDNISAIATRLRDLQSHLVKQGFFREDEPKLLYFLSNVDYLCLNTRSRALLRSARDIMKKDLSDAMEASGDCNLFEEDVKTVTVSAIKLDIHLKQSSHQMPKCRVSKSTVELLNLINQVLLDCSGCSDGEEAMKLFCMARNILELYCAVSPEHHKQYLEHFPQHVALFHNNCMFLAHCLLTVGDMHHSSLPDVLQTHLITFLDQVTELRVLGTNVFLKFMQSQRNQMLDIMRNCGWETLARHPDQSSERTNGVQQCLKQLELLQSIWQPLLQDVLYYKAIGCQVNAFLDKLTACVLTTEYIATHTAVELVEMFKNVSDKMLSIFQEPNINKHVKTWAMFCELIKILGSSLRDINDRWANGKGPIAWLFQPEQIKQLVRALFQNTEDRAKFLARVK